MVKIVLSSKFLTGIEIHCNELCIFPIVSISEAKGEQNSLSFSKIATMLQFWLPSNYNSLNWDLFPVFAIYYRLISITKIVILFNLLKAALAAVIKFKKHSSDFFDFIIYYTCRFIFSTLFIHDAPPRLYEFVLLYSLKFPDTPPIFILRPENSFSIFLLLSLVSSKID